MSSALPDLGIGIDIGGTTTKAAVVDGDGVVIASSSLPTRPGTAGVLASAVEAAQAAAAGAEVSAADVEVVGIGMPGTVDHRRGTVRHAVNVGIGREEVDVARLVAAELGVGVHVEHDVRVAALGADWLLDRQGKPADDLGYLSIGTGVAAGYVRAGQMWRGSTLLAGEIGHIPIDSAGPRCVCGQVGCIEAIASGAAIERLWPSPDRTAAARLQRAAADGDARAGQLWAGVVGGLSRAVLMLTLAWDPQVIVLGGGVAAIGDVLREAIDDRLTRDGAQSEFLASLQIGRRLRMLDSSVPIGVIGAVRAAHLAGALRPS